MRSARAQLVTGTVQSRPTHHHARADTLPWLLLPGGQARSVGPNGSSWKPTELALQEGQAGLLDHMPAPDGQLNAQ